MQHLEKLTRFSVVFHYWQEGRDITKRAEGLVTGIQRGSMYSGYSTGAMAFSKQTDANNGSSGKEPGE